MSTSTTEKPKSTGAGVAGKASSVLVRVGKAVGGVVGVLY